MATQWRIPKENNRCHRLAVWLLPFPFFIRVIPLSEGSSSQFPMLRNVLASGELFDAYAQTSFDREKARHFLVHDSTKARRFSARETLSRLYRDTCKDNARIHRECWLFLQVIEMARAVGQLTTRGVYIRRYARGSFCGILYFAKDDVTSFASVYVPKWKTRAAPIIHFCTELSSASEIKLSECAPYTNHSRRLHANQSRISREFVSAVTDGIPTRPCNVIVAIE